MTRELLQQALNALEVLLNEWTPAREAQIQGTAAITALREALAAPQPEPVAWRYQDARGHYRYRKYVAGFDVDYAILKPVPLYATPPAAPAPAVPADQWKAAIDDELVCCHIGTTDSFPDAKAALKNLIDWHVSVALDPAVSSDAQALIKRGKSAAPAVPLTDDIVEKEFVSRGDDRGQGLHPYWKSAFREGWHFARAMIAASPPAPAVAEPLSDERIDEIFEGAHENMPKGVLFRTFIARAIEQAHGIGGGGNG